MEMAGNFYSNCSTLSSQYLLLSSQFHEHSLWYEMQKQESHNYNFIFGGGTRLCPGKELGIVKISTFLHYFVTRYRLKHYFNHLFLFIISSSCSQKVLVSWLCKFVVADGRKLGKMKSWNSLELKHQMDCTWEYQSHNFFIPKV